MFSQKSYNDLEKLIRIWTAGDQSGINSSLSDDEYIMEMMTYILSDDLELVEQGIKWLEEDFNRNEKEYVDIKGGIAIMIAYASCRLENQQQTLHYAKVAKNQFLDYLNLWDQALAFWFLGTAYQINGYIKETENALRTAKELLEKHTDAFRKYNFTSRDICVEYIRKIEQEIADLSTHAHSLPPTEKKEIKNRSSWGTKEPEQSSSSRTAGFDSTPMTTSGFTIDSVRLGTKKRSNKTPSPNTSVRESTRSSLTKRKSFHIVIPVDVEALLGPKSTSYTLGANLYNELKKYNNGQEDSSLKNREGKAFNKQLVYRPSPFNQRFPIYGKVTAGPRGEVTFESPTNSNDVTEDHQPEFFGIKHNIYSTKEKDSQVKINNTKTYGWLMVVGESMNKASPIPIDEQDYVLFYMINDMESCLDKIVVVTKPEPDEDYPTLIVKRLIATTSNSKRWGARQKKFYLHSDSSWDEYKDDIEVTENNQLIGEIIAVAKREK